eukprot:INCI18119.1.p1 GENE.INCI18119.1~~INCI18119.1.p1  ORF type:complete len:469 (+),score=77.87 INCI18119.1:124-1530(+)
MENSSGKRVFALAQHLKVAAEHAASLKIVATKVCSGSQTFEFNGTDTLIVSGDIGGTNSRFQLWTSPERDTSHDNTSSGRLSIPGQLLFNQQYPNEQYEKFADVLQQFFDEANAACINTSGHEGIFVDVICVAVAGPVNRYLNSAAFPNKRSWGTLEGSELGQRFGVRKFQLINDFEAQGYGVLTLDSKETFTLQDAESVQGAPIACIGAGTGLGECFLTYEQGKGGREGHYEVHASEGGHCDFSPRTELEIELLEYLKTRFHDLYDATSNRTSRVSTERVVSGPGIYNIYSFLVTKFPDFVDVELHDEIEAAGDQRAGVIAKNSLHGKRNSLCKVAMEIFSSSFGSEVGNTALKFLPFGGIFLTGGIAPKNIEWLAARRTIATDDGKVDLFGFMHAFLDKGRMSHLLSKIPVKIVLAPDVGERGAHLMAYYLCHGIEEGSKFETIAPAKPVANAPVHYRKQVARSIS